MRHDIVPKSKYSVTALEKPYEYDVIEFGQDIHQIIEKIRIAEDEMALITEHGIGTMAGLTMGAADISRQLNDAGYRSKVFEEGSLMLLQVVNQKIGILTNEGLQAIIEEAQSRFR